jgi:CheY-like chemotaxis protein
MKTANILLAEDSAHDAELTIKTLQRSKILNHIDVARDGSEALDYLYCRGPFAARPKENPILILLDLKMPKVDGIDVLRQIRADPDLSLIPVVVFTSSREERDVIDSYQLGVNAYIVKPVEFDQFNDCVRQIGLFWALWNQPPPAAT